ncbi:MAG: hypothetical protein AAFQ43_09715 [Bacteroidota bacterium]
MSVTGGSYVRASGDLPRAEPNAPEASGAAHRAHHAMPLLLREALQDGPERRLHE